MVVLLAGCGSEAAVVPATTTTVQDTATPPGGVHAALGTARELWEAAGLASYHYVFEDDCGECDPLAAMPRQVVVWGDDQYDPGRRSPSVEEMFDEIEQALDAGKTVSATFDRELGHPIDVAIDMESRPADGGTHWMVRDLKPGLPGDDVSLSMVEQAERLWMANGPSGYEYTLTVFCGCPLEGSVVTRVENGRVVGYDVLYDDSSNGSITPLAIDDMFRDLADLMSSEDGIVEGGIRFAGSARFHPELGYPIWVGLDIEVLADDPVLSDLPSRLVVAMSDLHVADFEVPGTLVAERAALQEARIRWDEARIGDYSYELAIHAMATADFTGPFLVVVEGGTVTSVTRAGEPVEPGKVAAYSVEEMFDLIDRYLSEGIKSSVLYHDGLGHPVFVQLDLDAIAVDGGLAFSVHQLRALGSSG